MRKFVTELPCPERDRDTPLGRARDALLEIVRSKDNGELLTQVERHFDEIVLKAIQTRETDYVNTMSGVFQAEIKRKNKEIEDTSEKMESIKTQTKEREMELTQLRQKFDRRGLEHDKQRKLFYKEVLMLREMVTRQRTDPKTIKAIDGTFVLL